MKYSDKQTGKREEQLQRGLENLYGVMYREIDETITKYMKTMSKREREVRAQIDQGLFTPPNGDSDEEYMRKWRLNHVGMGKRWEAVRKGIAARITAANVRAADMINGTANAVYALNRNYQAYQIESCIPKTDIGRGASIGVAFDIVNENAVRRLESGKRKLLPEARVDIPKDQQWNMRKIQAELLSGIMQGKSVDKLARGFKRVADMNQAQAVRHARTALGGAICAGQQANIEDAQKMGIECLKEWVATLDDRTRDSHQALDGQRVEPDEVFSNGCAYPCDPNGEPKEVYNCRCALKTIIKGVNEERGRRIAKDEKGEYVYLDDVTYKGRDDTQSYERWFQGKIDSEEDPDKAREMAEEGVNEGLDVSAPEVEEQEEPLKEPEFKPAETVQEAEEQLAQYVNPNQFGAIGVSFKGVSLEVANIVNHAIGRVFENFDLGLLGGFQSPAGNTKTGKLIENAHAAYMPVRRALFLNRRDAKDVEQANEHIRADNAVVRDYFEHPEKYDLSRMSPRVRQVLENSEVSGRGLVAEDLETAIYHELGHHVEQMLKKYENADAIWAEMAETAQNVSGYACDSKSEYIAECFASYMKGEDKVGKETRAFFESIRRK